MTNQTQGLILGILQSADMIPSQVVEEVETLAPIWYAARQNVYRELRNLVQVDHLSASAPMRELHWATIYSITDAGRAAYSAWRLAVEPRQYLQDPILLRCALDLKNNTSMDKKILSGAHKEYTLLKLQALKSAGSREANPMMDLAASYYALMGDWFDNQDTARAS
jgi:DNA-binding PadR family transcriptional regulator